MNCVVWNDLLISFSSVFFLPEANERLANA